VSANQTDYWISQKQLVLSCNASSPNDYIQQILTVQYTSVRGGCSAAAWPVQNTVIQRCTTVQSCSIAVSWGALGLPYDPCPGVLKRLSITALCLVQPEGFVLSSSTGAVAGALGTAETAGVVVGVLIAALAVSLFAGVVIVRRRARRPSSPQVPPTTPMRANHLRPEVRQAWM